MGITPFRSFYQSGIPEDYSIDFFYAFNNKEDGAYIEEIIDVYFCGPKPMRKILKKQLKENQLDIVDFHYDNFQFK
nr:hypothetical protein [Clostridium estertheticum]